MSDAAETPAPPEKTHPRVAEFEGSACEVGRAKAGETVPGIIEAVYQPAPDIAPDARRAVVRLEDGARLDIATDNDRLEVHL